MVDLTILFYFFKEAADAAKSAMVSVIGLDSEKVQQLCDAANEEVDESNKVQIANYLCPVRTSISSLKPENHIMACYMVMSQHLTIALVASTYGREIMLYQEV